MLALALAALAAQAYAYPSMISADPLDLDIHNYHERCLQIDGPLANGTPVMLMEWHNATTIWDYESGAAGPIRVNGTNFCLDSGTEPENGSKLKIWECYDGLPAQQWSYNEPFIGLHQEASYGSKCLDLTDGNLNDLNPIQVWDCYFGSNQRWVRDHDR